MSASDPVEPTDPADGADQAERYAILDLSLRIGEVLLSSGAGAADVRAQMENVARVCGLRGAPADITFTALTMSYQTAPGKRALIQTRQVRYREIDYGDLTAVDHLVRDLTEGRIDRPEAAARLARIVSSGHDRPRWRVTLALGVMGAGVAVLLNGTWLVAAIAFVAAATIDWIQRRMSLARLPAFYTQIAGGLWATLLTVAVVATGADLQPSLVISASIIMLLAGVNFVGAVQDALTGYPLTASARLMEAMLSTAGAIAGVSGGIQIASMLDVHLGHLQPGAVPGSPAAVTFMAAGGAVSAAAFAYANYAPARSLLAIAIVAGLASALYRVAMVHGLGKAWASGLAALAVGLVAYGVAARVRIPALVVVVTSITPLLPGLSIYRGLDQIAVGGNGINAMVGAAAVAIALASGAILGEYLAQPLRREAHRLEARLAGPRLVGPIRIPSKRKPRKPRS